MVLDYLNKLWFQGHNKNNNKYARKIKDNPEKTEKTCSE